MTRESAKRRRRGTLTAAQVLVLVDLIGVEGIDERYVTGFL